jgi:hypothetical protein
LSYLSSRESLYTSRLFVDFFTVKYEKYDVDMANFKKYYDSAGFSKGISSIKNEKG